MANGMQFPQGQLPQRSSLTSCWVDRGRGYSDARSATECICERPCNAVLCHYCGFNCRGRVSIPCKIHQNVLFLTDIKQCPKCKAHGHMLSEQTLVDIASGNPGRSVGPSTNPAKMDNAMKNTTLTEKKKIRGRQ